VRDYRVKVSVSCHADRWPFVRFRHAKRIAGLLIRVSHRWLPEAEQTSPRWLDVGRARSMTGPQSARRRRGNSLPGSPV
jgi:hypothetical protein